MTALSSTSAQTLMSAPLIGQLGASVPRCHDYTDSMHRLFLTTNESGQKNTLEKLAESPLVGDAIVGPFSFFLLNAAAKRGTDIGLPDWYAPKIRHIIVCDRSLAVEQFCVELQKLIKLVNQFEDQLQNPREDLINDTEVTIEENLDNFFPGLPSPAHSQALGIRAIVHLKREIDSRLSWLSNDTSFSDILQIFRENQFHFVKMDLADPKAALALTNELAQQNITIDTLYMSNIEEYAIQENRSQEYARSLQILISRTLGYVVDAVPCARTSEGLRLEQRVHTLPSPRQRLVVIPSEITSPSSAQQTKVVSITDKTTQPKDEQNH